MTSNLPPQDVQNLRAYVPEPVLHKVFFSYSQLLMCALLYIPFQ